MRVFKLSGDSSTYLIFHDGTHTPSTYESLISIALFDGVYTISSEAVLDHVDVSAAANHAQALLLAVQIANDLNSGSEVTAPVLEIARASSRRRPVEAADDPEDRDEDYRPFSWGDED